MNHKDRDTLLRKKFSSYNPDLNESELWNSIEPKIKKPKSKRRFPLFVLLLVGIIGLYLIKNSLSETENNKITLTTHFEDDEATISTNKDCIEEYIEHDKKTKSINISNEQFEQTSTNSTILNPNKLDKYSSKTSRATPEHNKSNSVINKYESLNTAILNPTKSSQIIKNDDFLLPILKTKTIDYKPNLNDDFKIIAFKKENRNHNPIWNLSTALNLGKSFTNTSVSSFNTEIGLEAFSANIGLEYCLSEKWFFKLGLIYLHHNSKNEVTRLSNSITRRIDTIATIQNSTGVGIIQGEREFATISSQTYLRNIRSQQIILPISIHYTRPLKDKLALETGIGYGYSLWVNYNGIIQGDSSTQYDLNIDKDSRLRRRGNDRLILEAYFSRKIATLGHLKFGANYLHDLNGRFKQRGNINLKQPIIQFSVQLNIPLHSSKS